jgi:hypothetical protein
MPLTKLDRRQLGSPEFDLNDKASIYSCFRFSAAKSEKF